MRLSTLMLLIIPVVILAGSYIFLQLNQQIISIDFLFLNLEIKKGTLVIFSFLFGTFLTLILELLNYFRNKKIENE